MNCLTETGSSFEDAKRKAVKQYGDKVRFLSSRELVNSSLLGLARKTTYEVTFYLAGETDTETVPEAEAEVIEKPQVMIQREEKPEISAELLQYGVSLAEDNDFSRSYCTFIEDHLRDQLEKALPDVPSRKDVALSVAERISSSVLIEKDLQQDPGHVCVILGPKGSGKTTVCAKLASVFFRNRSVSLVSCDSSEGSRSQTSMISKSLGIRTESGFDEQSLTQSVSDLSENSMVIVDTVGVSPLDESTPVDYSVLSGDDVRFYLVIPAYMKSSDIASVLRQYGTIRISALIVTFTDQSTTVGNIVSLCHERNLPLVFTSDGKRIPHDFRKASVGFVMRSLRGFPDMSWAGAESEN